ncbi:MAG: glycosyltransferase [Candidatus Falkowbacteria bacterium]
MNKKIKICFISRSAYPLFNPICKATFGGAEVDLYTIANSLSEDSLFDVTFIVGDFEQKSVEKVGNIQLFKSYRFEENKLLQMFKLIVKIIKLDADFYIQEGASGGTGIISLVCKIINKKFIYRTASDIDCNGDFIKNNFVEGIFYKWGLFHASKIITQNESNKKQLKDIFNLNSVVIRNGMKIPKILKNDRNTILWIARSEKLKQPFIFLEIAKEFSKEKFIMICPEANFNSVDVTELRKKASEITNLTFIQSVPFVDINNYYCNAKIFINTSIYEGFPNTFVQSAINAVPIITLNVDPDNFLQKYKNGFCAHGNFSKIISEIKRILNSQNEWTNMSINAYNYALNNNDINKIILEYKKIFTKM